MWAPAGWPTSAADAASAIPVQPFYITADRFLQNPAQIPVCRAATGVLQYCYCAVQLQPCRAMPHACKSADRDRWDYLNPPRARADLDRGYGGGPIGRIASDRSRLFSGPKQAA